jgi:6-phosphofructokinase 2
MMVSIYTLTLSPSLDSATLTPQIYPEGKLRCSAPVFEPGGGGINVARAITHLGGKATAIFPQAVPPVNTWSLCWQMNRWP